MSKKCAFCAKNYEWFSLSLCSNCANKEAVSLRRFVTRTQLKKLMVGKTTMKQMIAVDLDGTLLHYDGWKGEDHFGEPLPGAKEFMTWLMDICNPLIKVVIYTTRTNTNVHKFPKEMLAAKVAAYLKSVDIPFDDIYIEDGKPNALAFIDDRGIRYNGNYDSVKPILKNSINDWYDKIRELSEKKIQKR